MAYQNSPPELVCSRALLRQVLSVRRKARIVSLLKALLAAIAFDLGYDLAQIGLAFHQNRHVYYPHVLPILFCLLAAMTFFSTRLSSFSIHLDGVFSLKDRLHYALIYRRYRRQSAEIVEAQARECLATIDFAAIRKHFAFRPFISSSLIVIFSLAILTVSWKYPYIFQPGNFIFRQGRNLVAYLQWPDGTGGRDERVPLASNKVRHDFDRSIQTPAPKDSRRDEDADRKKAEAEPPKKAETPEEATNHKPGKKGKTQGKADGTPGERERQKAGRSTKTVGSTPTKIPSKEITKRASPAGKRPKDRQEPFIGLAAGSGPGLTLPPIPLFRLLEKGPGDDFYIDPETIYIYPQAYQGRYRRPIITYFNKLRQLREESHGS